MPKTEQQKLNAKKSYENSKLEDIAKIAEKFKAKYPDKVCPEYDKKSGHSIKRYKKELCKVILGDYDVFDLMIDDKILQ